MRTAAKSAAWSRRLKSAALAIVLLVAEAFAVVHPLDFTAHATDEPCKICLSVASFGAADVASTAPLEIDAVRYAIAVPAVVRISRAAIYGHQARGPPTVS